MVINDISSKEKAEFAEKFDLLVNRHYHKPTNSIF